MLNHLAPTTGDRHVSHIKLLGDCTRCHDVCFCQRPGGGIYVAEPRLSSAQPPGQLMDQRTEGCGGARCKDENGTSRDAGAHPEQGQEIALAGGERPTCGPPRSRVGKVACRHGRVSRTPDPVAPSAPTSMAAGNVRRGDARALCVMVLRDPTGAQNCIGDQAPRA
jgi:hypothetical protein